MPWHYILGSQGVPQVLSPTFLNRIAEMIEALLGGDLLQSLKKNKDGYSDRE